MKVVAEHQQLKVNEASFEEFLKLNGFKLTGKTNGGIMAHKDRLNVGWHDSGFGILGESYDYPETFEKVCKIFAQWEPTWIWRYVKVHNQKFKLETD